MQIEKIYPASNIQASIVAGYLASNKKDYIGQLTIPVSNINHLYLNRAVQILYARHEALRTAFDLSCFARLQLLNIKLLKQV